MRNITLSQGAHNRVMNIITEIFTKYGRLELIDPNVITNEFMSHPELPKGWKHSHERIKQPLLKTIKILVNDHNDKIANMSDEDRRHYEMLKNLKRPVS